MRIQQNLQSRIVGNDDSSSSSRPVVNQAMPGLPTASSSMLPVISHTDGQFAGPMPVGGTDNDGSDAGGHYGGRVVMSFTQDDIADSQRRYQEQRELQADLPDNNDDGNFSDWNTTFKNFVFGHPFHLSLHPSSHINISLPDHSQHIHAILSYCTTLD